VEQRKGFAVFLIVCGALILVNALGWSVKGWIGYLFPIALLVAGFALLKRGNTFWGGLAIAFGVVGLLAKFWWLLGWLLAFVLIAAGVRMWKRSHSCSE